MEKKKALELLEQSIITKELEPFGGKLPTDLFEVAKVIARVQSELGEQYDELLQEKTN